MAFHGGPPPGGPYAHGPGPYSRPGGPPWGGPGGGYDGPENPIAACICCPCSLICYLLYACQEISYCCCGLFNCFGYDRRGPQYDHHHGPSPW